MLVLCCREDQSNKGPIQQVVIQPKGRYGGIFRTKIYIVLLLYIRAHENNKTIYVLNMPP